MVNSGRVLYTIGYSLHSLEDFLEILQGYGILAVVDVRSVPYSSFRPDFQYRKLKQNLPARGMEYLFYGRELGGRFEDPEVYVQGRADYERIARHEWFRQGLQRLRQKMDEQRLVLMCAEREPLNCHRAILISRCLRSEARIFHILEDGSLEGHEHFEKRLLNRFAAQPCELPVDEDLALSRLDQAYRLQGRKIAYKMKNKQ